MPNSPQPDPHGSDETLPVLRIDNGVATLRLNRPAVHNRLEPDDVVFVRDTIERINSDDSVRVLIVTGTGKSFCSGFDIRAFGSPPNRRMDFQALTDELENARPVTIAHLNGPAYGGATDMALACDFRIAVDSARMFMPAATIGLQYYPHGLRRWVTRLGLGAAKRLFLTAETIDAREMLRIGFLDRIEPAGKLDAAVNELARLLAAMPPRVMEGTKKMLNDVARQEFDAKAGQALHDRSLASRDMKEALAARSEKRSPTFTGD